MLIFVLYVLVISNWHANVNSNWNLIYVVYHYSRAKRASTYKLYYTSHNIHLLQAQDKSTMIITIFRAVLVT